MFYPSLSLKQELIDKVFSGANNGIKKHLEQTPSPGAIRAKKHHKKQKELRLQNVVVEECDECDYKTSKYMAMYRHKREKHSVPKQTCTDCDFSNIYPNKVKTHFNQVHRGMKRRILNIEKCRKEFCEYAGTSSCLDLQSHSLFFCDQCPLSFKKSWSLKIHTEKIHDGLVFNCEYCETSTVRKENLKKHMDAKHSTANPKRKKTTNGSSCKEEGCTFISTSSGHLKRHIETTHEGIITRLKCQVVNCNFETIWISSLRKHARVHLPKEKLQEIDRTRTFIDCVEEGCNIKVQNIKRHMKEVHIGYTHTGTKYICKFKNCNFETNLKRYLAKHIKRCKLQDSESVATTESVPGYIKSIREKDKSENSLCDSPGYGFASIAENKVGKSELTENLFIFLDCAMEEAKEVLYEIKKENEED